MTYCMLTSLFGAHRFGGDAAYVDRLSRALAGQGHEVHVIYCLDAFELVRGSFPEREYNPPSGVTVHGLRSWSGALSPLWTQQTGRPGRESIAMQFHEAGHLKQYLGWIEEPGEHAGYNTLVKRNLEIPSDLPDSSQAA